MADIDLFAAGAIADSVVVNEEQIDPTPRNNVAVEPTAILTGVGALNSQLFMDDAGWKPQTPTAVELDYFRAERTTDGIVVRWRTTMEIGTPGFRVLRSDTGRLADAEPVCREIVPAGGTGSTYAVLDPSGSLDSRYWLEETETDGDVILYGPVKARASAAGAHAVLLPIVTRQRVAARFAAGRRYRVAAHTCIFQQTSNYVIVFY